jgi:ferritin-like metal-binding protein YciE
MAGTATWRPREQRQAQSSLEQCFDTLGEAHNEDVYFAIERLIQSGEQVGLTIHELIRMLDGGMTLESLFDVIEVRMAGTFVH